MDNKLNVGNLPYSARDDDLQQFFAHFSEVASSTIGNRGTYGGSHRY